MSQLPWWRRSRTLFLAAFLAVAVVAGGARLVDVLERYRYVEQRAMSAHAATAGALASATEALIGQYTRVAATAADVIFRGALAEEARGRLLASVRRTYPDADGVIVLERSGRVVDADDGAASLIGRDLSDRPYYRAIREGAGTVVGDLVLSRSSGEPSVPIAVAGRAPDGSLRGLVVLGVRAAGIGRHLRLRLGGDAFPLLLDRDGRVIFHGAFDRLGWDERDFSGVPAVAEARAGRRAFWVRSLSPLTQAPRLGALVPVPEFGWAVGVLEPVDAALAPARQELRRALVSTSLVFGIGVTLALLLALRLSRPVAALARGVLALSEGRLAHRVQAGGWSEIGWLAEAFNGMAARLEEGRRQERELNEELRIANDGLHANMAQLEETMGEIEEGRRRAAFLADVSTELAASLDYEATLERVAWLAVPGIADWCFIDLRGEATTRRVAVAHADASSKPLADELRGIAFDLDGRHPVAKALRTGEPELVACVTDAWLAGVAGDDAARLETLRRLGPRSYIFVPLLARGRTLGVVSFVATTSRDHYGPKELALVQEVARRAALAIDNARLHQALEAERARVEAVLRQLPVGVIVAEAPSGRFILNNGQAARILGLPAAGEPTLTGFEGFRPDGQPYRPDEWPLSRSIRTGERVTDEEIQIVRADGGRATIWVSSGPVVDRDGRIVAGVVTFRDVTQRKQMETALKRTEEQLRQSQKMEAVGQLAGGVAHDFNNLLTAITGYSDLLLQEHADGQAARDLEEIRRAADRAASLTRQLLAFSRQQVLEPRVLDLNTVVADVEKMLRRLIGEDIELDAHLDPDLARVKADPGQLEQVILNLAVNARDAMADGGKLTIETGNADLDEAYAREHASVEPGRYVMLAVTDTGCGMAPEVRARIFEPFFTTKGPGKGTGLGLSTVYGIVKQSGGNVWCYSEPGRGTTFKIYLPQVDEPLDAKVSPRPPIRLAGGAETVLLVEDEKGVRALARRVLEGAGYTVLEARDGQEAVRLSDEHRGPIAIMVTDMVMPGASGPDLAARLSARRPEMKVLYMSGYTDKAIRRQQLFEPGTPFLNKPFTPAGLAGKVREVLDAPSQA